MSDDPLLGPFPDDTEWHDARVANGHPALNEDHWNNRLDRLIDSDLDASWAHFQAWADWEATQRARRRRDQAKERAALRATLPHPNWQNRQPTCIVPVTIPWM